jgi:hypothetical protein
LFPINQFFDLWSLWCNCLDDFHGGCRQYQFGGGGTTGLIQCHGQSMALLHRSLARTMLLSQ